MNRSTAAAPMRSHLIELTPREISCFAFAVAVHSLLFLWQGGILTLPEKTGADLGTMVGNVGYLSEIPNWDEPAGGGGGGSAGRPKSLFSRMKSFIKRAPAGGDNIAKGDQPKIEEAPQATWAKADMNKKLSDKTFFKEKGFKGNDALDDMAVAKGQNQDVAVTKPSEGTFQTAKANLKENAFRMAKKDVPFPIINPKSGDALANVNAIPVNVGRTTSNSVKSLEGGVGSGNALQSKSFTSKGGSPSAGSMGFGGKGNSGSGGSSGTGLAMGGGSSGETINSGSGGGTGSGNGSGSGSGTGSGSGSGTGSGEGSGSGSAFGGGRAWGGGGGGMGGAGSMSALPRNTVAAPVMKGESSGDSRFNITGSLRGRPIAEKKFPSYELDGRVALRFRVNSTGHVLDGILVEISSGSPSFDQKVLAALKQWLFAPLAGNRSNEIQEGVITFVFKGV